jgi:hypothetical protein
MMTAQQEGKGASGLPVHFIYHVPKCAGQTINCHLAAALPTKSYYRTRKRRGAGRFFLTRHYHDDMPDPRSLRVIGGHYLGISIEPLFQGRAVQRSMLLRDPVSHIVSYYNFRMMRYIKAGLRPYDFELAYEATRRNFITHYILRNFLELSWLSLAGLSDEDKYDLVNAFLSGFRYVGDYTLCDDLIAMLAGELGIARTAPKRNTRAEWLRRVRWTPLDIEDLTPGAVARIRQENLIDQRLWESWREVRAETQSVRRLPLGTSARSKRFSHGAQRLVSQITRRIHRRFGTLAGIHVPTSLEPSAQVNHIVPRSRSSFR